MTDEKEFFFMCGMFCLVVVLLLLNFGGCQYKEYKLEQQKLRAQAEGKLPAENTKVIKLDDQQLQLLLEALKGGAQ